MEQLIKGRIGGIELEGDSAFWNQAFGRFGVGAGRVVNAVARSAGTKARKRTGSAPLQTSATTGLGGRSKANVVAGDPKAKIVTALKSGGPLTYVALKNATKIRENVLRKNLSVMRTGGAIVTTGEKRALRYGLPN